MEGFSQEVTDALAAGEEALKVHEPHDHSFIRIADVIDAMTLCSLHCGGW